MKIYLLTKRRRKKFGSNRRQEKKKRNKYNNAERDSKCRQCGYMYAALDDPKRAEDSRKCSVCRSWFHKTCAEENGVSDDLGFFCGNCV